MRASYSCPGVGMKLPRGELSLVLLNFRSYLRCSKAWEACIWFCTTNFSSQNLISVIYSNMSISVRVGDQRLVQCLSAPDVLGGYSNGLLGATECPVIVFLLFYCFMEGLDLHEGMIHCGKRICRELQVASHTIAG